MQSSWRDHAPLEEERKKRGNLNFMLAQRGRFSVKGEQFLETF